MFWYGILGSVMKVLLLLNMGVKGESELAFVFEVQFLLCSSEFYLGCTPDLLYPPHLPTLSSRSTNEMKVRANKQSLQQSFAFEESVHDFGPNNLAERCRIENVFTTVFMTFSGGILPWMKHQKKHSVQKEESRDKHNKARERRAQAFAKQTTLAAFRCHYKIEIPFRRCRKHHPL